MKTCYPSAQILHRKTAFVLAVIAGALVLATSESQAALITKSSADFNYKYEADVLPDNVLPAGQEWILRAGGPGPNTASVSGGILSMSSPSTEGSYEYYESQVANWLNVTTLTAGFTVEIRLKVDTGKTYGGIQLGFASDTSVGAGLASLVLSGNNTQWLGQGVVNTNVNDDGFHVFRIVKLASTITAGKFNLYRDGVLILDDIAGTDPTFAPPNRFFFGDYGSFDSAGDVDYVRWDTTGAFAPVPEPTTLGLIGGAALALGLLRRRRGQA